VDEYRLMVFPVVVGNGQKLFEGGVANKPLKLVDTQTFPTGVVVLTYEPQREEGASHGE
jgi:dihydrofolate reductase